LRAQSSCAARKAGRHSLRAIGALLEAEGQLNERGQRYAAAGIAAMLRNFGNASRGRIGAGVVFISIYCSFAFLKRV
jgi:hypothetical protein